MNKNQILLFIPVICLLSCKPKTLSVTQFDHFPDTLKLTMQNIKGNGPFSASINELHFNDPKENHYGFKFSIPNKIEKAEIATIYLDVKPLVYKSFINGKRDSTDLNNFVQQFHVDTSKILKKDIEKNYLSVLIGVSDGDSIIVVDQNNNLDFSDDTIRSLNKTLKTSKLSPIEFIYEVYDENKIKPAYSWIIISTYPFYNSAIFWMPSEHLESKFSILNTSFTLSADDSQDNFVYLDPVIALTEKNGEYKDSLANEDLIKLGEYLKIENEYYQFNDISNEGSRITLLREPNYSSKTGTQIGMLAPYFAGNLINGDSISLDEYKGKYLMIVNVSACWSEESSYEIYKEISDYFKGKIEILGVDNSPGILQNNIKDLNLTGKFIIAEENLKIQSYRPDFCSRTCFLINPDGRVIDRFEIFVWESYISRINELIK